MGWSSGTDIFDRTIGAVLSCPEIKKESVVKIAEALRDEMFDNDWDTHVESEYYDHPIVGKVFDHEDE
jgi:hypothetical protein